MLSALLMLKTLCTHNYPRVSSKCSSFELDLDSKPGTLSQKMALYNIHHFWNSGLISFYFGVIPGWKSPSFIPHEITLGVILTGFLEVVFLLSKHHLELKADSYHIKPPSDDILSLSTDS